MEKEIGIKYDEGKPQYGLIPPRALLEIVKVLTFGARKYSPDNWKKIEDIPSRYFDAMQRHIWDWKSGEKNDPDSGYHHLAHAACCLLFIIASEFFSEDNNDIKSIGCHGEDVKAGSEVGNRTNQFWVPFAGSPGFDAELAIRNHSLANSSTKRGPISGEGINSKGRTIFE